MISIKNYNYLAVAVIATYLLFQSLYVNRVPDVMVDEPWYGNTAYNFSQTSHFVNTCPGSNGGDVFIVYTFIMGSFYKLFGCSLFVTRIVSVLGGLLALLGMFSILRLFKIKPFAVGMICLMFVFSNVFFIVSRSGRPEAFILAFGLWSVFFAFRYYSHRNRLRDVLFSALFGVLALGSHPHGAMFLASAAIIFLLISVEEKNVKPVANFALASAVMGIALVIIVYITLGERSKDILAQFSSRNSFSNNLSIASNISNFFSQYTLGIKRLYILLFEMGVILMSFLYFRRGSLYLKALVYSVVVVVTFSFLIFNPYSARHFGEVAVFSMLILAVLVNTLQVRTIKVLYLFSALYLLNNMAGDIYLLARKAKNVSYDQLSHEIDKAVPDDAVTISMLEFWFPLKDNESYNQYTRWEKMKYKSMEELIASKKTKYIILSDLVSLKKTGTSGRERKMSVRFKGYFDKVNQIVVNMGVLEKEIKTDTYGTVRIWKVN
ncbi:MAG TPA: glycosyltransferase family 39 protein [Bacteroidales bacterium]|nr:glycosyltransferase family 39 protein [Bacteroidales bacterium]